MTDPGTDAEREIEIEVEPGDERASDDDTPTDRSADGRAGSSDRSLGDELGRIDLLTTPEGYVEGRVTDLTSLDATTVRLEVTLPHEETVSFTLEKPIPWSREFLLARIVEDVGYDAASIDHLLGESIYLVRTDAGPTADEEPADWWTTLVRATGEVALATLSDRFRLEDRHGPEWRLVDPLERPDRTDDDEGSLETAAIGLVLLGVLVAVAGAIVGATGGLVLSPAAVGYALPGFLLALLGLYALAAEGR
ncbi:hypothetical protein [Natronobeatus ordinarius]|uniref:hypothetical protein n=1 Tax=Natronobeatus ordinarius TaxID=2963433 RepID=UPI0020CE6E74|nr:hypothetical protein [Natronobeatus ordinarius]